MSIFKRLKLFTIWTLVGVSMIFGFQKVCCLSVLESFEDLYRYRKLSTEELRFTINKDSLAFIKEIKSKIAPSENIAILNMEMYFIGYYIYPIKMYKYKKGYFDTSCMMSDIKEVDPKWLKEKDISWVINYDVKKGMYLKRLKELL